MSRVRGQPTMGNLAQEVAATDEAISDTVIPDGETWEITRFAGSAAYLDDTIVCLVWDRGGGGEEIITCTHGDQNLAYNEESVQRTGDGVKKLAIVLTNDTGVARIMSGCWEALILD